MSAPMFSSLARSGTLNQIAPSTPLTPQGVLSIVERIAQRAAAMHPEMPELARLKPHDIRRSFCGMARDAGADIQDIKHAMGHSSMVTTERYLSQIPDLRLGHTAPDRIKVKVQNLKKGK